MDLIPSLPTTLRMASVLFIGLLHIPGVAAQTEITSDYIYIGFEAEDHLNKNERWVTTTPSTPTEENDPDGNHSDGAGGSTYLELLPDIRVTHDDPFGPPLGYWGQGGQGPDADYIVNFPEPGRYYVHVRAYSTGTEDNGMHVGLNGTWPDSGHRMQFCTAHRRAWWWSSAQRDAGGNGSCGIEKSIWLDVPSAGQHTVSISAREDGFEIDRIVLLKDLSGNTRVCEPTNITGVNCRNGSIESADGFVDLRVRLETIAEGADPEEEPPNQLEVDPGANVQLTARIENLDAFDTATDIVLTLSPVANEWTMVDMDNRCEQEGDEFICTLDDLHPTAPNENAPFEFILQADASGDLRIDASVLSAEVDDAPANDVAATIVSVSGNVEPVLTETDLSLVLDTNEGAYETGDTVLVSAQLSNLGEAAAEDVAFNLTVPAGLNVNDAVLPFGCTAGDPVQCGFESIDAASDEVVSIELIASETGIYTLSASLSAANDSSMSNNFDSDSIFVTDPEPPMTTTASGTDGETDGATGSSDSGGTDAASTAGTTGGLTGGSIITTGGITSGTTGLTAGSTTGQTTAASTDSSAGSTAGDSSSSDSDSTAGDSSSSDSDSDAGATSEWFVLLLVLLFLTRLNGRHERQRVTVRN